MKKILIVHTLGIGDMVMFTPAFQELRRVLPGAVFDFLIEQKTSFDVVSGAKGINRVFYLKDGRSIFTKVRSLRREEYDLAIFTSGMETWKIGPFSVALGCRQIIGEHKYFRNPFFSISVKCSMDGHRVQDNLRLVRSLCSCCSLGTPAPRVWVSSHDRVEAEGFFNAQTLRGKKIVGVHSGSTAFQKHKRWPLQRYVETLKTLNKLRGDLFFLIFAGPGEEGDALALSAEIPGSLLVSGTSLKVTAAILERCAMLIANDSALGHLAAAMNTPVLTIFGPTNPAKTAPWGDRVAKVLPVVDCAPCWGKVPSRCLSRDTACLASVTPEQVVDSFLKLAYATGL